jgi:DNA-binding transcriptional LysR family regulator
MRRAAFNELDVVLAVARHASFRGAALELAMSPTAVSSAIAAVENRLQVRLFHRTTRSVALTAAGQRYVERIAPALSALRHADDEAASQSDAPAGTLRINAAPETASMLFEPLLRTYAERYPRMRLDFSSERRKIDIVADGFDAGIRLADDVPQDMIAVPITGDMRLVIVASPDYLARHGVPQTPQDLSQHQGIYMRFSHGGRYLWELEKDGRKHEVDIDVRMVFGEMRPIRQAACAGLGLAFLAERLIADELASGQLVRVLEDWCPPFRGLSLYYPGRRYVPEGLRALIDLIHELRDGGGL